MIAPFTPHFIFEGTIRKHMFKKQREELGETVMDENKEKPDATSKCRLMYSCRNCGAIIYKDCNPFVMAANLGAFEAGINNVSPPFMVHVCRNIAKAFKYYGLCEFIGFEEIPGD